MRFLLFASALLIADVAMAGVDPVDPADDTAAGDDPASASAPLSPQRVRTIQQARSRAVLSDKANFETGVAAARVGVELVEEDARYVVAGDAVVSVARLAGDDETASYLLSLEGVESLSFGGAVLDISGGNFVVLDDVVLDFEVSRTVTVYDESGAEVDSASFEGDAADPLNADGILQLETGGPEGVAVVAMYGDIIIGSMPLDNFYD